MTLVDGNIADALGRPDGEVPRWNELVECAVANIDPTLLALHLATQLTTGPDSWTGESGRELIETSFEIVQRCADELDIPRQEPKGL